MRGNQRRSTLPFRPPSREVPADDVVGDGQEAAVRAFRTLDPGLLQTPLTHSFAHAGAYPALPVFRLSKRRGYSPRDHETVTGRSESSPRTTSAGRPLQDSYCAPVRSLYTSGGWESTSIEIRR